MSGDNEHSRYPEIGECWRDKEDGELVIITGTPGGSIEDDKEKGYTGPAVSAVYLNEIKQAVEGLEGVEAFRYGLTVIHRQGAYPFAADRLEPYGGGVGEPRE